jgi:hypothetical protein
MFQRAVRYLLMGVLYFREIGFNELSHLIGEANFLGPYEICYYVTYL